MSLFDAKTVTLGDGAEVLLRSPEEDEAPQLLEYLDAVRHETQGIMYSPEDSIPSVEEERQWVKAGNDQDNGIRIAAAVDGKVVGLSEVISPRFARQKHTAGVGISIRADWCDRGLGTLMMREMIGWSRTHPGLEMLTLCVFSSNPRAQAVYEKVGFVEDGRLPRRAKVDGEYIDLVEMSLWLDQVEVV